MSIPSLISGITDALLSLVSADTLLRLTNWLAGEPTPHVMYQSWVGRLRLEGQSDELQIREAAVRFLLKLEELWLMV